MLKKLLSTLFCTTCLMLTAQDAYFGDWKGTVKTPEGEKELCAQVTDCGKGTYRARFKSTIYQVPATPVLLQLDGKLAGDQVVFADGALVLKQGVFAGKTALGEIALKPYVHQSPTLGLQPPAGATVLIGPGLRMSQWHNGRRTVGIVNLNKVLGKQSNCIAYLKTTVTVPNAVSAMLYVGSDDGAVVFLNGKEIHRSGLMRAFSADEDKIPVQLNAGDNTLLLKVLQGGGDWAARARLCDANGQALPGARTAPMGDGVAQVADGSVMGWLVAGPFRQDGTAVGALFDTAFAPETGAACDWETVVSTETAGERWDIPEDGVLAIRRGGGSIRSIPEFGACTLHLEFRTTLMAEKRGQGRCNSGVYMQGRTEFQVLDSYALKGENNECGGVYQHYKPLVNMCLPPGQWQTYDFDFVPATLAADGKTVVKDGTVTLRHNGVVIHDHVKLVTTPGGLGQALVSRGPLLLQDHGGDVVAFRNVWFVEK